MSLDDWWSSELIGHWIQSPELKHMCTSFKVLSITFSPSKVYEHTPVNTFIGVTFTMR